MKTKAIVFTAVLLLASLPLFAAYDAFMKIDTVPGESRAPGHEGWIDILSFSWGVAPGAAAYGSGGGEGKCRFHEFTIQKVVDKSSPKLAQMAITGNTIPSLTLDVAGERHLLQKVLVTSVQQAGQAGDGSVRQSIKFNFATCATHETPATSNAMGKVFPKTSYLKIEQKADSNGMFALGGGQGPISLHDIHFLGSNQAIIAVREAAGGMLLPAVNRAFQSKQRLPLLTLSGNQISGSGGTVAAKIYMTFTFHDVLITGVSSGGDYNQITLNFGRFEGPAAGFHDISVNK